jgi:hypothetical protein
MRRTLTQPRDPAVATDPVDRARRRWWQRRWLWVATAVLVALAGFVLYWFQPQKLLIDDHANDTVPAGDFVEVARGQFVSREHGTSGVVRVLEFGDGRRIVRLDDLRTSNGPALYVYLTANPAGGPESAFDDDYADLGELKGNLGSQNYDLPSTADLDHLGTIVIWCDRFDAAFGAADLAPI